MYEEQSQHNSYLDVCGTLHQQIINISIPDGRRCPYASDSYVISFLLLLLEWMHSRRFFGIGKIIPVSFPYTYYISKPPTNNNGKRESWLSDPRFIIGSIMFVSGLVLNVHADSVLLNLRAQKEQEKASKSMAPGAGGYKIPYGGLFEYVSCANYSKIAVINPVF